MAVSSNLCNPDRAVNEITKPQKKNSTFLILIISYLFFERFLFRFLSEKKKRESLNTIRGPKEGTSLGHVYSKPRPSDRPSGGLRSYQLWSFCKKALLFNGNQATVQVILSGSSPKTPSKKPADDRPCCRRLPPPTPRGRHAPA